MKYRNSFVNLFN